MAKKPAKDATDEDGDLTKKFNGKTKPPPFNLRNDRTGEEVDVHIKNRHWFANKNWYAAYTGVSTKTGKLSFPKEKAGVDTALDTLLANGARRHWTHLFVEDKSKRMKDDLVCLAMQSRQQEILRSKDALDILSKPPYNATDPAAMYRDLKSMSLHVGNVKRDGAKLSALTPAA